MGKDAEQQKSVEVNLPRFFRVLQSNNYMSDTLSYDFDEELEKLLKIQGMEPTIRKMVGTVLQHARSRLSKDIRTSMGNDPRQAYRAVRRTVYRRILGGNLNILSKRKAGKTGGYTPRRPAGADTIRLNNYNGADRGFILRFLNNGTKDRVASTMDAHGIRLKERPEKRVYKTSKIGARGKITGRNFFESNARTEMEKAMGELCDLIDVEFKKLK